jgi:L-alanine-DL-glutamate epimerase-like enolase superfamily enzyme
MKTTDLKVWVTAPDPSQTAYVFLQIETDEGISRAGEATSSGGGDSPTTPPARSTS